MAATSMAQEPIGAARPGDDFFAYANAAWLDATELPAGRKAWNARNEIDAVARARVATLIDDAGSAPRGTSRRKVGDFRAAWLDDAAIEAKGLAPLRPLFDRIDRVRDRRALARLLGSEMRADVDPLYWGVFSASRPFGLAVQQRMHGANVDVAYLLQGGLGLATRDAYLDASPDAQALRAGYLRYIARMLDGAGFDESMRRAEAVLALEVALARVHASTDESGKDANADHLWTRADFARNAPGMDWVAFFDAAGLAKQEIVVAWQADAITGEAALVAGRPLDAWKDYLRFHELDRYAEVLPRAFAEPARAWHAEATGTPSIPREEGAREATKRALPDAIGRAYVDLHFPAADKARLRTIVANVKDAFARRVEAASWMSPATRAIARETVRTTYFGIAYPERWKDDYDLRIDARDPIGNLQRIAARDYRLELRRLGRPVDPQRWVLPPQTAGAVLVFQLRAYNFGAGLLQAPKFDAAASDAVNYGSIGTAVGHELSHYVDSLGREFDRQGRPHPWWTPQDIARFDAACEPLVEQFAAYRPLPDTSVDGRSGLSENVADLAGLVAALDAFHATLGAKANDAGYVREQDRAFFIAYARGMRTRASDEALRAQSKSDHAPEPFRVATVRNLDAWYAAFDVRPGDALYLAPGARVRVW